MLCRTSFFTIQVISTYIWILNNNKSKKRKGKIQLINATGSKDEALIAECKREFNRFWEKMPRSLGKKRKLIPENGESKGIGFVTKLYGDFKENEFVKIFPNEFLVIGESPSSNHSKMKTVT